MMQKPLEPKYDTQCSFYQNVYTIDTPVEGGTAKVLYCSDKPVMSVWNEIPFGIDENGKPTSDIRLDPDNNTIAQYQIEFLLQYTNVGFANISVPEWNKLLDFGENETFYGEVDTKDELGSPHIYVGLDGIAMNIGSKKLTLCSRAGSAQRTSEELYDMLLEALSVCGDYGQALIERYESNPTCREAFVRKAECIKRILFPQMPERSPYSEKILNQATAKVSPDKAHQQGKSPDL